MTRQQRATSAMQTFFRTNQLPKDPEMENDMIALHKALVKKYRSVPMAELSDADFERLKAEQQEQASLTLLENNSPEESNDRDS